MQDGHGRRAGGASGRAGGGSYEHTNTPARLGRHRCRPFLGCRWWEEGPLGCLAGASTPNGIRSLGRQRPAQAFRSARGPQSRTSISARVLTNARGEPAARGGGGGHLVWVWCSWAGGEGSAMTCSVEM